MIQFKNLTLARGVRPLIVDANLQVHAGWRVGLVGANGSGKSSLFALLRGELHADLGDCELPPAWRIASVAQETPALDTPAIDYVLDGDTELREIERELAAAEKKAAETAGTEYKTLYPLTFGRPTYWSSAFSRSRVGA